jgi:trk system potassium uptake protein TrkH
MRPLLAVVNVLGALLMLFSGLFLLPIGTALLYGEHEALLAFAESGALSLALGALMFLSTRLYRRYELKPRDGYLLVTLGWLGVTTVAAVPLMIQAPYLSFTDAYFEAMSGLSTTGSTVISGLDNLPHALNLWRASLHWLGGMGIIVLAVAILPLLGVGGMQMYRAETPGPVKDAKLTPRITQTAKALWLVYCGITAACVGALMLAGMDGFDALCHAFAAMALGGFSTHDASIGWFHSPAIEAVLMLFMVVAAINFATHFVALRRGDARAYARDPEARWVVVWIAISALGLSVYLWSNGVYPTFGENLRHASFSVVSMATTTGFVTVDFGTWPLFASMWMLFLTCVVCSTGSTGGGIKTFRALILIKQALREMLALVHPSAVTILKIGGHVVANRVVYSVLAFIFAYFMTVVLLTFMLLLSHMDFISAFTAVIASINNAGPGLGAVGPATNYAGLSNFQTWVCTAAMFLGRIELFTFFVLFTPMYWRK